MKVSIGCEESGVVAKAFRNRGHEAYSCDLQPTRGNPEWHIQGDVMDAVQSQQWDLIILHPDCTAMAVSGNRWYGKNMSKHHERDRAIQWTLKLWNLSKEHAEKVALENPVSVIFSCLYGFGFDKTPVQYIQPWMFGHKEYKKTGLALHNLPELKPNKNWEEVKRFTDAAPKKESERIWRMPPGENRKRDRSETYQGIADAMAEQWGGLISDQ